MNSSCVGFVMDLAQVPLPNLMARQSYSYTYILYRGGACDGTVLDRSVLMMFTPLLGLWLIISMYLVHVTIHVVTDFCELYISAEHCNS